MKLNLGGISNTVFSGILGSLITIGASIVISQQQNQTKYIDYRTSNDPIFSLEKNIPKEKLKVIVNNNTSTPAKEVRQITLACTICPTKISRR
jgi:5-bromo-4-chloroindolyl phosphate hydrolysis protein